LSSFIDIKEMEQYFDLQDLNYCSFPLFREKWLMFQDKMNKHSMLHRKEWIMGFLFYTALRFYSQLNGITGKDKPLYWLTLLYMYVDGAMDIDNVDKNTLYRSYSSPETDYWKRVHYYKEKLEDYNDGINFLPLLEAQIESSENGDWRNAIRKGEETGNLVDIILFGEVRNGGRIASIVQIIDDLIDIPEDMKANIETPATTSCRENNLTELVDRTVVLIEELPQPYPIFFSYAIAYIVQKYPTQIRGYNKLRSPSFDPLWSSFLRREINVRYT
jgi:hypothetical protein